ncbi:MAG TPA: methyltransferase domain-containing protein [Stellaceae bacterium]|jgi:predicted SAM-dependent methyltransferase|nr:methyltransferase domain-containing protein [Stellaceae bacterium]
MGASGEDEESGFFAAEVPAAAEGAGPRAETPGEAGRQRLVLNVGCGYPPRTRLHPVFQTDEWRELRLDIDPAVKPDICCSMTEMTPVATDSVDAVWSSHNLEHLHRHEVPLALREFCRVLRPGGMLLLTLPDLQRVAELVAADTLEEAAYMSPSGPITPLDMIFGHTASLAQGRVYMAHKTGFTATSLQRLLGEAGFAAIEMRRSPFDLWARAHKPAA